VSITATCWLPLDHLPKLTNEIAALQSEANSRLLQCVVKDTAITGPDTDLLYW